jgi:hypothetical protein
MVSLLSGLSIFNLQTHAENVREPLQTNGFSASSAIDTSLDLDGSNTPYVAYRDNGNGGRASVMRYNGSSWEYVGTAGFSPGRVYSTSLKLDSSNMPYVAFKDYADDINGIKVTVMKYNGASREYV